MGKLSTAKKAAGDALKKPFNSALIRKIRGTDQYKEKTIKGHKMKVKISQKQAPRKEKKPVKQKVQPVRKAK